MSLRTWSLTVCWETAYAGLDGPGLASALQELGVHGWNGSIANGLDFIKKSSKGTPARWVYTLTCPFSNEAGRCSYRVRVVSSGPDNDPATRHVMEVPSKATSWQHNGHDLTSATHDQVPKFLKSLVGAAQLDLKPKNLINWAAEQGIHLTGKGQIALKAWQKNRRNVLRLANTGLTAAEARTWGGLRTVVEARMPGNPAVWTKDMSAGLLSSLDRGLP